MNDANSIKNDLDAMKQYLKDLYTLETEKFCLEQALSVLKERYDNLGVAEVFETGVFQSGEFRDMDRNWVEKYKALDNKTYKKPKPVKFGSYLGYVFIVPIIGFALGIFLTLAAETFGHNWQSIIPKFGWGGLIIGIIMCILGFKNAKQRFNLDMKAWDDAVEKDREYVEKARIEDDERVKNEIEVVKPKINVLLVETQKTLTDCNLALDKLYSIDVIYNKYRNLIAISQIYEYFMAGRCEALGDAYNMFETELRLDTIIGKLDIIIEQLEEIKTMQYMIYKAIMQGLTYMHQIEENTASAAYNTSLAAANTSVLAYNSSVIASKTEIMARYNV